MNEPLPRPSTDESQVARRPLPAWLRLTLSGLAGAVTVTLLNEVVRQALCVVLPLGLLVLAVVVVVILVAMATGVDQFSFGDDQVAPAFLAYQVAFLPWAAQQLRGEIFANCEVLEERADGEGTFLRVRGEPDTVNGLRQQAGQTR